MPSLYRTHTHSLYNSSLKLLHHQPVIHNKFTFVSCLCVCFEKSPFLLPLLWWWRRQWQFTESYCTYIQGIRPYMAFSIVINRKFYAGDELVCRKFFLVFCAFVCAMHTAWWLFSPQLRSSFSFKNQITTRGAMETIYVRVENYTLGHFKLNCFIFLHTKHVYLIKFKIKNIQMDSILTFFSLLFFLRFNFISFIIGFRVAAVVLTAFFIQFHLFFS